MCGINYSWLFFENNNLCLLFNYFRVKFIINISIISDIINKRLIFIFIFALIYSK